MHLYYQKFKFSSIHIKTDLNSHLREGGSRNDMLATRVTMVIEARTHVSTNIT